MINIIIDEEVIEKLNGFNNPLVTKSALNIVINRIQEKDTIKDLGIRPGGNNYGAEAISYGRFTFICFEDIVDQETSVVSIRDVLIR